MFKRNTYSKKIPRKKSWELSEEFSKDENLRKKYNQIQQKYAMDKLKRHIETSKKKPCRRTFSWQTFCKFSVWALRSIARENLLLFLPKLFERRMVHTDRIIFLRFVFRRDSSYFRNLHMHFCKSFWIIIEFLNKSQRYRL